MEELKTDERIASGEVEIDGQKAEEELAGLALVIEKQKVGEKLELSFSLAAFGQMMVDSVGADINDWEKAQKKSKDPGGEYYAERVGKMSCLSVEARRVKSIAAGFQVFVGLYQPGFSSASAAELPVDIATSEEGRLIIRLADPKKTGWFSSKIDKFLDQARFTYSDDRKRAAANRLSDLGLVNGKESFARLQNVLSSWNDVTIKEYLTAKFGIEVLRVSFEGSRIKIAAGKMRLNGLYKKCSGLQDETKKIENQFTDTKKRDALTDYNVNDYLSESKWKLFVQKRELRQLLLFKATARIKAVLGFFDDNLAYELINSEMQLTVGGRNLDAADRVAKSFSDIARTATQKSSDASLQLEMTGLEFMAAINFGDGDKNASSPVSREELQIRRQERIRREQSLKKREREFQRRKIQIMGLLAGPNGMDIIGNTDSVFWEPVGVEGSVKKVSRPASVPINLAELENGYYYRSADPAKRLTLLNGLIRSRDALRDAKVCLRRRNDRVSSKYSAAESLRKETALLKRLKGIYFPKVYAHAPLFEGDGEGLGKYDPGDHWELVDFIPGVDVKKTRIYSYDDHGIKYFDSGYPPSLTSVDRLRALAAACECVDEVANLSEEHDDHLIDLKTDAFKFNPADGSIVMVDVGSLNRTIDRGINPITTFRELTRLAVEWFPGEWENRLPDVESVVRKILHPEYRLEGQPSLEKILQDSELPGKLKREIPYLLDQAKSGKLEWYQFGRALLGEIMPVLRDWERAAAMKSQRERIAIPESARETEREEKFGEKTKVVGLISNFIEAVRAEDKWGVTNERLTNKFLDQMAEMTEAELMAGARELYPDKKPDIALAQMYADMMATIIDLQINLSQSSRSYDWTGSSPVEIFKRCIGEMRKGNVTTELCGDLISSLGRTTQPGVLIEILDKEYPNQKGDIRQAQFYADMMATILDLRRKKA